jgi:hypothetical protein
VGTWRVEAWAGRGVYGVVYRAVPVNAEHANPVALKLALFPRDPRFAREVELLSSKQLPPASDSAEPISSRSGTRSSRGSRSMVAAGLALAIWAWWAAPSQPGEEPPATQAEPARGDPQDTDTAGLGEAVAASFMEPSSELCAMEVLAEDTPPEPQPGQARPDAKGRCPHKRQVALNDGCWVETSFNPKECEENGGYVFKKTCYLPVISPWRPSTSSPPDKP